LQSDTRRTAHLKNDHSLLRNFAATYGERRTADVSSRDFAGALHLDAASGLSQRQLCVTALLQTACGTGTNR
jgi:hypothetical protein